MSSIVVGVDAGVNGTVVINMLTQEVAVEDIPAQREQPGQKTVTAHQKLLDKQGWKRQHCFGAAIQKGEFRPVSGYINGIREAWKELTGPGKQRILPAFSSLEAEQEAFQKFCKHNDNREKALIPEDAQRVANRLASEGGGKETFSMDALLQAGILEELASRAGGHPSACKELLERALQIRLQHLGLGPDRYYQVALILADLGNAYVSLGERAAAKSMLAQWLPILEEHCGPDSLEVAATLDTLSRAHAADDEDRHKEKQILERALRILEQRCGPDDPMVSDMLRRLAALHGRFGDNRAEKQMLVRALQIAEKHYRPHNHNVGMVLMNLGVAHGSLGEYGTATQMLERGLPILKRYGALRNFASAAAGPMAGAARRDDCQQLISFRVVCTETTFGEQLKVVGSAPELGAWSPEESQLFLRTSAEDYPVWQSDWVPLPAADLPCDYKLVICGGDGGARRWEPGPNRRLPAQDTLKAVGPAVAIWEAFGRPGPADLRPELQAEGAEAADDLRRFIGRIFG